ncbi:ABC transporter ATP-binding protein [Glycomyces algeriensis]|uniref:Dipeptide/oligopeptide/nickel ABC transporter ATP-binding protein n=1 Tax=Glycomyces algeriensis TaxID=256037 RepID=A0A9W6LE75_9ACTN|nr:ABC transporter ATP-binding protein [Glycomyces algeriensis]MDA1367676.1 ABC transporter ATP-binding protein [Glycomyces algeriensis]MDR7352960.1 peptide/nickel transport system ATP-binding protein [Glycomyces algeriensis]GLI40647.1 dipeptide/oligopeptide/nickel ABC transporter ATP-binding protein [Glycomyces algeriensis]
MALLEVEDLRVAFGASTAVDGVSFSVPEGKVVGLVGESGCGKSVTSLAIMGLLPKRRNGRPAPVTASRPVTVEAADGGTVAAPTGPPPSATAVAPVLRRRGSGADVSGRAVFDGTDLLSLAPAAMRRRRGKDLAMVFQDPLSSLNPVVPIGRQITEVLERHRGLKGDKASKEAANLLDRVGIPDPTRRLKEYPHQLSGGMRQRVLIAIAVACNPRLLIADEPTTALDVTIQAQILELLKDLVEAEGTALLMITHDLGVVAGICDEVNVLYSGRVVESAPVRELFAAPTHPYTVGLLGSIPRLDLPIHEPLTPIRGSIADVIRWHDGCAFAPRCDRVAAPCVAGEPALVGAVHAHRCVMAEEVA